MKSTADLTEARIRLTLRERELQYQLARLVHSRRLVPPQKRDALMEEANAIYAESQRLAKLERRRRRGHSA